jgi:hypothetical protein
MRKHLEDLYGCDFQGFAIEDINMSEITDFINV